MATISTREIERKKKRNHWRRHLQKWRESGLPQTQYCRKKNLSLKSFVYWKRTLAEKIAPSHRLVPVPVEQIFCPPAKTATPQSSGLTLVHNQTLRVEIAEEFNPATLGNLLRVLEGL